VRLALDGDEAENDWNGKSWKAVGSTCEDETMGRAAGCLRMMHGK
jgi:hypothetical protein